MSRPRLSRAELYRLVGLVPAAEGCAPVGDGCDCTTHCLAAHQAAHDAILDDRDLGLTMGLRLPAVELRPYPDRRGLPVYRIGGGRG